jgi:hypothetical protein
MLLVILVMEELPWLPPADEVLVCDPVDAEPWPFDAKLVAPVLVDLVLPVLDPEPPPPPPP